MGEKRPRGYTMDHQYITDNNLIERYVLGRLPVAEQLRFEEHFAECSECVAELELADDFSTALRAVVADDARRALSAGLAAALTRWLRGPRIAMLLGVLVMVVALPFLWLASENQRLTDDLEALRRPRADVPAVVLDIVRDTRSDKAPPTVAPPTDDPWLTLAIEVGAEDPRITSFDVVLEDAEARPLWRGEDLAQTPWGILALTFPAELVLPGSYRLVVTARDDRGRKEPVGTFPFVVEPALSTSQGSSSL